MATHKNWHIFFDDLASLFGAGVSGALLQQAIKNHATQRGKVGRDPLSVFLTCGGCLQSIYFSIDRIHHNHLQRNAPPPDIACPHCQYSGAHTYDRIE